MSAAVSLTCALVLLALSLDAINHMTGQTSHLIRVAFAAVATGEFVLLIGALFGVIIANNMGVAILNSGLLMLMLFDRRRRGNSWACQIGQKLRSFWPRWLRYWGSILGKFESPNNAGLIKPTPPQKSAKRP